MTKNTETGLFMGLRHPSEYILNPLTRINWRASLVPAAAVTPAPIAYIKVVAVKKLVVGFLSSAGRCRLIIKGAHCFGSAGVKAALF